MRIRTLLPSLLSLFVFVAGCRNESAAPATIDALEITEQNGKLSSNFNQQQLINLAQEITLKSESKGTTVEANLEKSGKYYYLTSRFKNSEGQYISVATELEGTVTGSTFRLHADDKN